MLNEERIILMTHLASYEEGEGKKNAAIDGYFRDDYIGIQVVKSVISATIAFAVIFGLYILYNLEELLSNIYKMDLFAFAKNVLLAYGVTVVAYAVITYLVYAWRYRKARKGLKHYYSNLKKLSAMYGKGEKNF